MPATPDTPLDAPPSHWLIEAPPAAPAPLPQLEALLPQLQAVQQLQLPPGSLCSPAEHISAHWQQLPGGPGHWPFAALATGTFGQPCAWLRPVHLALGLDSMALMPPQALPLRPDESRALLAACAPLLQEDGLHTQWHSADRWLAQGHWLSDITAPSPEHSAGLRLSRTHLPQCRQPAHQRTLARLSAELEMLLATHPVNHAREAAGQPPINALWLHGGGQLDAPPAQTLHTLTLPEAEQLAPTLLARTRSGQPVHISLCGPSRAITLHNAPQSWWQRLLPRRQPTLAHWLLKISE